MKTIVALATAPMNCAIHIIRISGDKAFTIVQKICHKHLVKKGYTIQYTSIFDGSKQIDDVLLMKYVAPKSYTGEDLIEINCHGGIVIVNKIIELLIKNGAIQAKRGEFTQRALLNGKINLLNANGINNSINAKNLFSLEIAQNAINNKLTSKIKKFINELFDLIGTIEVNFDYPEYDGVDNIDHKTLLKRLKTLLKQLQKLYMCSQLCFKISQGFNIAIIGKPNVGKSSLLNKFLNESKAIVSNIPGTTRDSVEGSINYQNITFNFIDTAGIRSNANMLEKLGIKKTMQKIKIADLVIVVLDSSKKMSNDELKIISKIKSKHHIVVLNKSDLKRVNKYNGFLFSCKKSNISILFNLIIKKIGLLNIDNKDMAYLQTSNEIGTLKKSINNLQLVINKAKKNVSIDLLVELLHESYNQLNELIGNGDLDFLDKLFASFCVGK